MRHFAILLAVFPLVSLAQPQPAQTEQSTLQTLLAEVQQLRVAIERQTLLSTRTQIAISQLQLQENTVARSTKEYAEAQAATAQLAAEKVRLTAQVRNPPPPEIATNAKMREEWD